MLDSFFFFFNDTATTEIYTLSLHDALPISGALRARQAAGQVARLPGRPQARRAGGAHREHGAHRSEEHTSELQSRLHLVCRLLLEKKKEIAIHDELDAQVMPDRASPGLWHL